MEIFQWLFSATMEIFKIEFTLYGFTFSFWDIFLWTTVAGIVLGFVGGLLWHD